MYTGKDNGTSCIDTSLKKTTNVVLDLVKHYAGSYRSIKTDRYYTSIELAVQLEKMKLYNTGTVMTNRIPKELRWNKKKSKDTPRGDYERHVFKYKNRNKEELSIGLVIWKDRKPVYVLTNEVTTIEEDDCKRRSKAGLLDLKRPRCITVYN